MKNLFRYLATSLAQSVSINQPALNHPQNNHSSNVHATFFTPSGDLLQIHEKRAGNILYGAIQIQLRTPYIYLSDAAFVLHHFIKGLQQQFAVVHATEGDYRFSKITSEHVTTVYWQDATGTDWKVCGWTNGEAMRVHYIKNVNELPVWQEDVFLSTVSRIRA